MCEIGIKSKESFKSGELLRENKLFASSIHSYYYSCLQFMIFILVKVFNKSQEEIDNESKNHSFHNWLINLFHSKILTNDGNKALRFHKKIQKLKRYRVEADYKNIKISESKSITSTNLSKEILELLKKEFLI